MKKLLLIIYTTLFFAGSVYPQLKIKTAATPIKDRALYDSLHNYIEDIKLLDGLVGQDLYVIPKSEQLKKHGYEGFFTTPISDRKYMYKQKGAYSSYEDIVDRKFKVIGVINGNSWRGETPFLKIADEKDTLFYEYPNYRHSFCFIVSGYLRKMEQKYVHAQFYFTHSLDKSRADLKNGKEVPLISGDAWTCKELILDPDVLLGEVSCVLENDKGESLSQPIFQMKYCFLEKKEGDRLKKKYGALYEEAIKGNVRKGMPAELVIIALGEPEKINTPSDGPTQWVYSNGECYYFKNSILSAWN